MEFSGASGSAAELKKFLADSREMPLFRTVPPVVFLDEIHRFNRAQQDILLPFLERGEAILIGATTENPGLLPESGAAQPLPAHRPQGPGARPHPAGAQAGLGQGSGPGSRSPPRSSSGSPTGPAATCARRFQGLETWMEMPDPDLESLQGALGGRMMFDRADGHYDLASAFQKSLRGSDADAALYYLSRMIRGGEDPRFIARRLMVCAAEDVGNADPQAFLLCEAASRAVEQIGWPEARIPLAQAVIYVANAPKSNATVLAVDAALAADDAPIPEAIRDAHTATARKAGRGAGYHYSHDDYDREQTFLPDKLKGTSFYEPKRPQERNWLDHQEPDATALARLWTAWVEAHPEGGELPLEAWSAELACSREALARSIHKLAQGKFTLGRKLEAKPV